MAKKASSEAEREAKQAEEDERRVAAEWSVGSKVSKNAEAEAERDRKLKLKAENAALLEAEESVFAGIPKKSTFKKKVML